MVKHEHKWIAEDAYFKVQIEQYDGKQYLVVFDKKDDVCLFEEKVEKMIPALDLIKEVLAEKNDPWTPEERDHQTTDMEMGKEEV